MILLRLFWLIVGVILGLILLPALIIGCLILLVAFAFLPLLIPLTLIVIGGLVVLVCLVLLL
jgi:hypothetical protein